MKKLNTLLCATSGLAFFVPAFACAAEDCHFQGSKAASQETVSGCAVRRQQTLITGGKIDTSWRAIKPAAFEQVDGQRGKEWKVTLKDPAAADKAKESRSMFFTAQGHFIAANFNGKRVADVPST